MKSAYLAVGYICNENCIFCPCTKKEKQDKMITEIEDLIASVDEMERNGITDITLSGGEPTLHPQLPELIMYIQRKRIRVTVLSNGERFSSVEYIKCLSDSIDMTKLRVITTLHSSDENEHEQANQTKGSFCRSVNGLKTLSKLGARIIIKHCITKHNYKDLLEFYKFYDGFYSQNIDIQLCSIDYCGMPEEYGNSAKLLFTEIKPYLEELFDYDIELKMAGNRRKLYCINIPLCTCDPYYWKYMSKHREGMYDQYKDPHTCEIVKVSDNAGIHDKYCRGCKVKDICCGTYYTAYEVCGKDLVKPYI